MFFFIGLRRFFLWPEHILYDSIGLRNFFGGHKQYDPRSQVVAHCVEGALSTHRPVLPEPLTTPQGRRPHLPQRA